LREIAENCGLKVKREKEVYSVFHFPQGDEGDRRQKSEDGDFFNFGLLTMDF